MAHVTQWVKCAAVATQTAHGLADRTGGEPPFLGIIGFSGPERGNEVLGNTQHSCGHAQEGSREEVRFETESLRNQRHWTMRKGTGARCVEGYSQEGVRGGGRYRRSGK